MLYLYIAIILVLITLIITLFRKKAYFGPPSVFSTGMGPFDYMYDKLEPVYVKV
jgi:cell shape-determining protein MreC